MRSPKLETFRRDIEHLLSADPFEPEPRDLSELTAVVLEQVAEIVPVPAVVARIEDADSFAIPRARDAIECFANAKSDTDDFVVADEMQKLREIIPDEPDASGLEAQIRLAMTGRVFENLLVHASEGADFERLHALLAEALAQLPDSEVGSILQKARDELDPIYLDPLVPPGEAPPEITTVPMEDARSALAKHILAVRPVLQRRRFSEGRRVPAGVMPALGTILGAKVTRPPPAVDRRFFTCLASLHRLWAVPHRKQAEFAEILCLGENAYIENNHAIDVARWSPDKPPAPSNPDRALLSCLLRLLHYASAYVDWSSPEVAALRAYKLGLETVWDPKYEIEFELQSGWHEERFQRHAIRFLVERGIAAFGTKQGRAEVDMRVNTETPLIVEVKVYRATTSPTEGVLRQDIGQKLEYMDREEPGGRAVLFVYNFTNTFLLAPQQWIDDQHLILVVNLCPDAPSTKKRRLQIRPAQRKSVEVIPV